MVKTRLDERVNEAYESARKEGGRRYVFQIAGLESIAYSKAFPKPEWTDGWVVIVDPTGFAAVVNPEQGEVI